MQFDIAKVRDSNNLTFLQWLAKHWENHFWGDCTFDNPFCQEIHAQDLTEPDTLLDQCSFDTEME